MREAVAVWEEGEKACKESMPTSEKIGKKYWG